MKELVRHIFKRDYLSRHPVEDPQIASLISIVDKTKRGPFREMEEYPKLLLQKRHEADSRYSEHLYESIDIKWFLKLANQLYAIEQLGKSRNRQALVYLRNLSRENVREVRRSVGYYISPDTIYHEWTEQEHLYPNARGELRHSLDFNIRITTTSDWGDEREASPEERQSDLGRIKRLPPHQILNKAIATLEQDLASP